MSENNKDLIVKKLDKYLKSLISSLNNTGEELIMNIVAGYDRHFPNGYEEW